MLDKGKCNEVRATLLAEDQLLYDFILASWEHNPEGLWDGSGVEMSPWYEGKPDDAAKQYLEVIRWDRVHTAVDGGYLEGSNTRDFLQRMPEPADVYAFEPLLACPGQEHRRIKDEPRLHLFPLALSVKEGLAEFDCYPGVDWKSSSRLLTGEKPSGDVYSVHTTTLDGFVHQNRIGKVDFIKLDIEGAELDALEGAKAVLVSDRPQLSICIYHKAEHLYDVPLFLAHLLPGYQWRLRHYSRYCNETVWYGIPMEVL